MTSGKSGARGKAAAGRSARGVRYGGTRSRVGSAHGGTQAGAVIGGRSGRPGRARRGRNGHRRGSPGCRPGAGAGGGASGLSVAGPAVRNEARIADKQLVTKVTRGPGRAQCRREWSVRPPRPGGVARAAAGGFQAASSVSSCSLTRAISLRSCCTASRNSCSDGPASAGVAGGLVSPVATASVRWRLW